MSSQTVLGVASLLVSAAGVYFGVALARELPPFEPSSATPTPTPVVTPKSSPQPTPEHTPTPTPCPRLEYPTLEVSVDEDTNQVTVEWSASGGCEPFSGILTRAYLVSPTAFKTYTVSKSSDVLVDEPPCRVGEWELEYELELRDAVDHREAARARYSIDWPNCLPGVKPILIPISFMRIPLTLTPFTPITDDIYRQQ